MIDVRQPVGGLAAAMAVGLMLLPAAAQTITNGSASLISAPANLFPSPSPVKSPVDVFRELLAMTPPERETALSNRPPAIRVRIRAKLKEYAALEPNERELRLQATELRWYLLPLLREPPGNRADRLRSIPNDLQPLVRSRLAQWDILPPPLQKEFLDSDRSLGYFARIDPARSASPPPLPPGATGPRGSMPALTDDQRERIGAQFNQFFELTPLEKQKALNTLSASERQQMEKALATFGQLPPVQRLKCIQAFTEFAGMSPAEKQDFLKNAQRWSRMSPNERQAWRDLVAHVPQWPPFPPASISPPYPTASLRLQSVAATNPN